MLLRSLAAKFISLSVLRQHSRPEDLYDLDVDDPDNIKSQADITIGLRTKQQLTLKIEDGTLTDQAVNSFYR